MSLDDLSDEDLLSRYIEGEESAYGVLMRRHEDRIFALAVRMLGDRADALDATQDAFVSAFRRASSFRGESTFGTWLYRIGINACRDVLRARKRLPEPHADPEPESGAPSHEGEVIDRMDLARALGTIPEEYAKAVALHDLGGVSYDEISKMEVVPVGTVKSRISRGRRMLAETLEQQGSAASSKRRG